MIEIDNAPIPTMAANPVEWVDGHREEIVEPDWQGIERALGEVEQSSDDARGQAADILSAIMAWVWSGRGGYASAMIRFVAFTAGLRPDLLNDATYLEIGRRLGVTKQSISKTALLAQKAFGLRKFGRSRDDAARARMSRRAMGHAPTHVPTR